MINSTKKINLSATIDSKPKSSLQVNHVKIGDVNFSRFCTMPGFQILNHRVDEKIDLLFFYRGLLVESSNGIMGRCALYLNSNHDLKSQKVLTIGYFESYNDDEISSKLFNEASNIARELNCSSIVGPINGTSWNDYRFITGGNSASFTAEYSVPGYYVDLWKSFGFATLEKYRSDRIDLKQRKNVERIQMSHVKNTSVKLSDLSGRNIEYELERIGKLCLESFAQNLFYTPIGISNFLSRMDRALLDKIRPYVILAESEDGELMGFLFSFPNFKDANEKGLIIKTFARKVNPEYKGLGKMLCQKIYDVAIHHNFQYLINAYYHVDNTSGKLSKGFNGEHLRTYELLNYKL